MEENEYIKSEIYSEILEGSKQFLDSKFLENLHKDSTFSKN